MLQIMVNVIFVLFNLNILIFSAISFYRINVEHNYKEGIRILKIGWVCQVILIILFTTLLNHSI